MHRTIALLLVAAALVPTAPALGADPPPSAPSVRPKDRTDELFEQATAAYKAGRLAEAEAKLAEAWTLRKTHDIAGNLGSIEFDLGKYDRSAEHLSWALRHFPPSESDQAREDFQRLFEDARSRVAALRVRVNVSGAEITVNGRVVGVSPVEEDLFAMPGAVEVLARLPGRVPARQVLTISKGTVHEVALELRPVEPAHRSVIPGVVLAGLGGAAVTTGIILFAASESKLNGAKELSGAIKGAHRHCEISEPGYDARCPKLHDLARTSDRLHNASVGAFIGGAALGTAAALYLLWPSAPASTSSPAALRFTPSVGPTGGSLFLSGSF